MRIHVQVRARAEGLAVAAEDDRAQRVVRREAGEGMRQFGDDGLVEGVAHLGAIEEHAGHGAGAFDLQRLGHGLS